jgi:hypothetical protein
MRPQWRAAARHRINRAGDDVRHSCPGSQYFPLRVTQISRLVAQFNQQYTLFCPANKKEQEVPIEISLRFAAALIRIGCIDAAFVALAIQKGWK